MAFRDSGLSAGEVINHSVRLLNNSPLGAAARPIIPALGETEAGGSPEVRSFETSLTNMVKRRLD